MSMIPTQTAGAIGNSIASPKSRGMKHLSTPSQEAWAKYLETKGGMDMPDLGPGLPAAQQEIADFDQGKIRLSQVMNPMVRSFLSEQLRSAPAVGERLRGNFPAASLQAGGVKSNGMASQTERMLSTLTQDQRNAYLEGRRNEALERIRTRRAGGKAATGPYVSEDSIIRSAQEASGQIAPQAAQSVAAATGRGAPTPDAPSVQFDGGGNPVRVSMVGERQVSVPAMEDPISGEYLPDPWKLDTQTWLSHLNDRDVFGILYTMQHEAGSPDQRLAANDILQAWERAQELDPQEQRLAERAILSRYGARMRNFLRSPSYRNTVERNNEVRQAKLQEQQAKQDEQAMKSADAESKRLDKEATDILKDRNPLGSYGPQEAAAAYSDAISNRQALDEGRRRTVEGMTKIQQIGQTEPNGTAMWSQWFKTHGDLPLDPLQQAQAMPALFDLHKSLAAVPSGSVAKQDDTFQSFVAAKWDSFYREMQQNGWRDEDIKATFEAAMNDLVSARPNWGN